MIKSGAGGGEGPRGDHSFSFAGSPPGNITNDCVMAMTVEFTIVHSSTLNCNPSLSTPLHCELGGLESTGGKS